MQARRFDAAKIGQNVARDGRGFLSIPAFLTRTGVFTYRRADGTTVRELRHPDEVFHPDSLATLRAAPVTVDHPRREDGTQVWVDADNARQYEVGHVDNPRSADSFIEANVTIRRSDVAERVTKRELQELSCGYDLQIDPTPGVYQGQRYDQAQIAIRYNHVALLPKGKPGRAGPEARLRLDSADAELVDDAPISAGTPPQHEERQMRKVRIDGIDFEIPDPAATVVERQVTALADLQTQFTAQKKRADSAEAERDIIKTERDTLKTDLDKANDPKAIQQRVQARVALERQAGKVLGEKRLDSLSDREVRELVLKELQPEFKCEGRSDDGVTAAFELAISRPTGNRGLALVQGALNTPPENDQRSDADEEGEGEPSTLEQARQRQQRSAFFNRGK